MTVAISCAAARQGTKKSRGRTTGHEQWRTGYMGPEVEQYKGLPNAPVGTAPQIFLDEIMPDQSITPHFHQVDQFTILVGGSGSVGRNPLNFVSLYYTDRYVAYGPLKSGPCGMALFTVRPKADPGGVHLHMPGYEKFRQPWRKRFLFGNVVLSVDPVLQARNESAMEHLFEEKHRDDGLDAAVIRLGGNGSLQGPDPATTNGQTYIVLNGTLQQDGQDLPKWSLLYVGPGEAPLTLTAGQTGAEVLLVAFPKETDTGSR